MPEDLIQRWKSYRFVFSWDGSQNSTRNLFMPQDMGYVLSLSPQMLRVLQMRMSGSLLVSLADCHRQIMAQSLQFTRIFQARWLLLGLLGSQPNLPSLYQVHLLLGVSWDDIIAVLSTVRAIVDQGSQQVAAGTLTILAVSLELFPANIPNLISDLSCGLLRIILQIDTADRNSNPWRRLESLRGRDNWGSFIRFCPCSSTELLYLLHNFVPPLRNMQEDLHNILQWLQGLPNPPLNLIQQWLSRFSGNLCNSEGIENNYSPEHFERQWRKKSEVIINSFI
ncbi:hypothetical protein MVEN_02519900 [Mycena venus]|uniref:Uncharacterized protein n=1 Tax=Mycena venus TaxID=2733690 RepID=A0A8H7CA94_9AGAR|nr:hypothetical protein MVEN_02519900 [Mycena venus]